MDVVQGTEVIVLLVLQVNYNLTLQKANERQRHYNIYLLVNELFTRKIDTIFIRSNIYYWLPPCFS